MSVVDEKRLNNGPDKRHDTGLFLIRWTVIQQMQGQMVAMIFNLLFPSKTLIIDERSRYIMNTFCLPLNLYSRCEAVFKSQYPQNYSNVSDMSRE